VPQPTASLLQRPDQSTLFRAFIQTFLVWCSYMVFPTRLIQQASMHLHECDPLRLAGDLAHTCQAFHTATCHEHQPGVAEER
jgi:hypothetical protein